MGYNFLRVISSFSNAVAEELNIKDGDVLSLRVKDNKIILEQDNAILLSLKGKKFAKISLDEIGKISEEEQNKYGNSNWHKFYITCFRQWVAYKTLLL